MEQRIQDILAQAEHAFNRGSLLTLWQSTAENFYPERADFTTSRSLGTDLCDHLSTSKPIVIRRTLGDSIGSMLRSREVGWMKTTIEGEENLDYDGKRWLEWATKRQLETMYGEKTNFVRATKEGDHDFASFGNCVISTEVNRAARRMLYRCHHLRDVAWMETFDGQVCPIFVKFERTAVQLEQEYQGNVSPEVKRMLSDPVQRYQKVKAYHCIYTNDATGYENKKFKTPYISITIEKNTGYILREEGSWTKIYTIPRWSTVSGFQYGYSPAVVAGLPDARLLQQIALAVLDAAEKAVSPPMIATQEMVRSDLDIRAAGVTWVAADYDERLGEVLRPLTNDSSGLRYGFEMSERIIQSIENAFYIDSIGLPPITRDMTAFETAERIKEYVRRSLPLFEPIESQYNAELCNQTFEQMWRNGMLGAPDTIPQSLRGADIKFKFKSPLHDNMERQKVQKLTETQGIVAQAAAVDPSITRVVNTSRAVKDTLAVGVGIPQEWLNSDEEIEAMNAAAAQQQQQAQTLALLQQGGVAAEQIGKGGQALRALSQ